MNFMNHKQSEFFSISDKPINIAYMGPSVTTYENFNPAYRIYYVDGNSKVSIVCSRDILHTSPQNIQGALIIGQNTIFALSIKKHRTF